MILEHVQQGIETKINLRRLEVEHNWLKALNCFKNINLIIFLFIDLILLLQVREKMYRLQFL